MNERKKDMPEALRLRVQIAAQILSGADGPPPRGWRGDFLPKYDSRETLEIFGGAPGEDIWYVRPQRHGRNSGCVHVWGIEPREGLRDRNQETINTGGLVIIDGHTVPLPNYNGLTDMSVEYEPSFRDAIRENDVFMFGFTQSIKATFGYQYGSEAAQNKFSASIEALFEARQEKTHEKEKTGEKGRRTVFPVTAPPGVEMEAGATMSIQQKKLLTTGKGDVDFGFRIGLRTPRGKGGRDIWSRHHGHTRHCTFHSFWNEFVPVVKGEIRAGKDCAGWFFERPVSDALFNAVTAPLDLNFRHETPPYDGWVNIEPYSKIIRVNPDINPELYEKWQTDLMNPD